MSTSRLFTLAVAAFFGSTVSIVPGGSPAPPSVASRPTVAVAEVAPAAPPGIELVGGSPPRDVELEVAPDGHGDHRVVVRRRGFLVSLRNEDARSAGQDWTALRISPRAGRGGPAGRLIWETTPLEGLETTRGTVLLRSDGGTLAGTLQRAMPPTPARAWQSPRATCRGQHDGLGGFSVLCRFARAVRVSGAVNVTGARSLDDAWLVPGPSPLVRLDLPRSPGSAAGRVIGMTQGLTGVALRVEATFVDGEEPALLYEESERAQPVSRGF